MTSLLSSSTFIHININVRAPSSGSPLIVIKCKIAHKYLGELSWYWNDEKNEKNCIKNVKQQERNRCRRKKSSRENEDRFIYAFSRTTTALLHLKTMLTLDCNQNIIFHWTRCLAQQKKTGSFYGTKNTSLQVKGGSSWTWDSLLFFYTWKKPQLWSSFLLFAPIIPCSIGSKLFNRLHTHAQYDTVQRGKLRDSEYREKVKCVHECCTAKLYSFFQAQPISISAVLTRKGLSRTASWTSTSKLAQQISRAAHSLRLTLNVTRDISY